MPRSPADPNIADLTARAAAALIRDGKLTAEALTRACLERIAEKEPAIGAWTFLDPEHVLAQARACDRGPSKGRLHGLPVGIKDIIDTADMPTAYGSALYAGHRPAWDASCVALIRQAGGIVFGKTVSTEFAALAPGKTKNPHNVDHTPGGSSSGSAAAVAAGMVPLAIGTQTSGSLIRPASFCGVVAYKPTRGTIDKTGVKPLADSLDTVGVMARNVGDAAFFSSVLSGRPDLQASNAGAPRIGLYKTPNWNLAQPETHDAVLRAQRAAEKHGARVVDVATPPAFADLLSAHDVVMDREMLHALAFERLFHPDKLARKTRDYLGGKTMPTPQAYDDAQRKTTAARDHLGVLFETCDVLLTPAAVGEAPKGLLDSTGDPTFNRIWTLLGVPCVTVPTWRGGGALPVGIQIVGPLGADLKVLAAAAFLENALNK